jgi:hypothetical protein
VSYNLEIFGTVSGTPVTGDVVPVAGLAKKAVTLSANYVRNPPPGWPRVDAGAPLPSYTASPQTIASGTTLTLFAAEAAALVNGGFATYA